MRWFFPSAAGDFRLESVTDDCCVLKIMGATPREMEQLHAFVNAAVKAKWLKKGITINATDSVDLKASVAEAGKELIRYVRAKKAVLTTVRMANGELVATDETGADVKGSELDKFLDDPEAQAAVSVSRPTPSCPDCQPGAVTVASEVLQAFMTPQQHESWAKSRQMVVTGHLSGHRYLLSHRHHPRAVKDTRICFDLDGKYELKFHDWSVPPEEEVLAAKLILENREPWLRNEATLFHVYQEARAEPLFKNPFGAFNDGVADAAFFKQFGRVMQSFTGAKS